MKELEPLLSPEEAAKILGTSKWFIYMACESGRIKSAKLGKLRKIRPSDLQAYIDDHMEKKEYKI